MEKKPCKVFGFEGLYDIYEDGTIFSVRSQRMLKPSINKAGYYSYTLTPHKGEVHNQNSPARVFKAHRLVLIHFISPPPFEKAECNHKDHVKSNNHYSNLEWVTHSENILKSFRDGGRVSYWKGKKKGPYSDDVKAKMAAAKNKPVLHESKEGIETEYGSIQLAADALGIDRKNVYRSLTGGYRLRSGHKFTYIPQEKREKELLGLPFVKPENVHGDYCPIDFVPDLDFSTLGAKLVRVGRNLYINRDGYHVNHYVNKKMVNRSFTNRKAVLAAYNLEK